MTKSVHISCGKLDPLGILMHKHTKYDLAKRGITSIPSLAEIVVVHSHTKTDLVPQKGKSVTFARSQIISPALCRSAVKPKQYNSNSRKHVKHHIARNLALDMTAYDSYRKMRTATQKVVLNPKITGGGVSTLQ